MSRHDSGVPIYALDAEVAAARAPHSTAACAPVVVPFDADRDRALQSAEDALKSRAAVADGDLIVLSCGEPMGKKWRHQCAESRSRRRAPELTAFSTEWRQHWRAGRK